MSPSIAQFGFKTFYSVPLKDVLSVESEGSRFVFPPFCLKWSSYIDKDDHIKTLAGAPRGDRGSQIFFVFFLFNFALKDFLSVVPEGT